MSQVERTLQRARSPAIAYLWPRRLKPALYSGDAAKAGVRFPAYGAGRRIAEYIGDAPIRGRDKAATATIELPVRVPGCRFGLAATVR